ncbi:MAG: c-type cytochrome [Chloroflexi bacterium]|nr:c-type cytochrome [Chloroflexota bacterium]
MNKWLRRALKILAGIVAFLIIVVLGLVVYTQLTWARPYDRPVPQLTAPKDKETVARGEYLYKYGYQCWGCHSKGTDDPNSPQAGGKEFDLSKVGPGFGVYNAPNLTSDPEMGIGAMSDGLIVRALREGLNRKGQTLFPVMPADWLKGLSDKDTLAIVAYLRSLPPVKNAVSSNRPSFAAKALFALKVLKPQPPITQPVVSPPPGVTVEYGKYLAENTATCADCHSQRNLNTGVFLPGKNFTGSSIAFGGELDNLPASAYAPNLTPDKKTGIGTWTEEQFIKALRTGTRPDGTVMLTLMPYPYFSFWTDDDLKAVYRYLQTVPAQENEVPQMEYLAAITSGSSLTKGEAMFKVRCSTCHGENGKGATPTSVALARVAPNLDDAALTNTIKSGIPATRMPGFAKTLSAEQLADLITFVRSWK